MDLAMNFNIDGVAVRFPFQIEEYAGRAVDFPVTFRTQNRLIYIPMIVSLPIDASTNLTRIGELDVIKIVTLDPDPIPDRSEQ